MDDKTKQWIDGASYEELLRKWRHAPVGDPMFTNETGEYYHEVMMAKKAQLPHEERVAASKRVGW